MKNEKEFYKLISALFNDYHKAEGAANEALKLGYEKSEISILMSEKTKKMYGHKEKIEENEPSDIAIKGAGIGGSLGVTTGVIIGAIIAMGTIFIISGVSLVISGPIAVAIAGASAGGIAGGLVGALMMTGISEDLAKEWAEEIKNGGILIAVEAHSANDYKILKRKWNKHGGVILSS
jgi:uncharacterized membrane protein